MGGYFLKCSFNFGQTLFLYLSEKDDEGEKFMETIEDKLEGFLYLPYPGEYRINPKIKVIKFDI